jgi:heme-degrading monooxygenase HmoA
MRQIIILVLTFGAISTYGQSNVELVDKNPIYQLRIYEVPKENEQVFHERFRDHAYRIMKKYNFKILAMWKSEFNERTEFVYLLEWENESIMKGGWEKFLADQEWKNIKTETAKIHGTFVNNIHDRTLLLTDYSPRKLVSHDQ